MMNEDTMMHNDSVMWGWHWGIWIFWSLVILALLWIIIRMLRRNRDG